VLKIKFIVPLVLLMFLNVGCTHLSDQGEQERIISLDHPYSVAEFIDLAPAGIKILGFDVLLEGGHVETFVLEQPSSDPTKISSEFADAHSQHAEELAALMTGRAAPPDDKLAQLREEAANELLESSKKVRDPEQLMIVQVVIV